MKKLCALLLTICVVLTATGCSCNEGKPPQNNNTGNVEITLDVTSKEIDISESIEIKATTKQTLEKVAFTVDDANVVIITAADDGKTLTVTGKTVGWAKITATVEGKTATCTITVVDRGSVPTIKLKNCENAFNVSVGDEFTIEAVILFRGEEKAAEINATTSDASIISVSELKLTANELGQSVITLSATYNGQSVTNRLTVNVLPLE